MSNVFEVSFAVPKIYADDMKAAVLRKWFKSSDPILTRHADSGRFATFTFECAHRQDLNGVIGLVRLFGGEQFRTVSSACFDWGC